MDSKVLRLLNLYPSEHRQRCDPPALISCYSLRLRYAQDDNVLGLRNRFFFYLSAGATKNQLGK